MLDSSHPTRPTVARTLSLPWWYSTVLLDARPGRRPLFSRSPVTSFDDRLVARFRQGETGAGSELVRRLYPTVLGIARALAPTECQQGSMAERMLVGIFKRLRRYRGNDSLDAWSIREAVRIGVRAAEMDRDASGPGRVALTSDERSLIGCLMSGQQVATAEESQCANHLLRKVAGHLPASQRLVFSLTELEGWSVEQVCRHTGWSWLGVHTCRLLAKIRFNRMLGGLLAR